MYSAVQTQAIKCHTSVDETMLILVYLHKFLGSSLWSESVLWQHHGLCDHSERLSFLKVEQFLYCTLHAEKSACLAKFINTVDLS